MCCCCCARVCFFFLFLYDMMLCVDMYVVACVHGMSGMRVRVIYAWRVPMIVV